MDEAELTTTYQKTVEDDTNDGEKSHDKDYQDRWRLGFLVERPRVARCQGYIHFKGDVTWRPWT